MLIPTDGICICTATHFGFGVGLGFGEADGLAESPAEPLPLGEAVACAMPDWVGSGMGGRLWPGACWSRSSWPRTISDTPARASRIGTEKPGRMRRRTDASLATGGGGESARALAIARTALAAQPAGLVTDLDGTLAPIVPVPSEAMLLPVASDALRALAGRLAVVAVITGRAPLDARRMLGSAGSQALVIGNHGLEWLEPGAKAPEADDELAGVRAVIADLVARVPGLPGVQVEEKGLSATIHYRQAPDPQAARTSLLTALGKLDGAGVEVREGRRSIELRPAGRGDKGSALRALVERFRLRGLVVAGDDATDLDMFAAARELGARGLNIAVLCGPAG